MGQRRRWQENNTSQVNLYTNYKEQNGQPFKWSGCITAALQVYIYKVKYPKGKPSLVRNSSWQVNDTADDIISFPVVD